MTPKMEAALEAAERAGEEGLHYTAAGWIDPAAPHEYHGPVVVSRLVFDRGYLSAQGPKSGPRQRRVITSTGREHLIARRASVDPRPRP